MHDLAEDELTEINLHHTHSNVLWYAHLKSRYLAEDCHAKPEHSNCTETSSKSMLPMIQFSFSIGTEEIQMMSFAPVILFHILLLKSNQKMFSILTLFVLCVFVCLTFSTMRLSVLMFLIHQPTPTARSSDHCGSPLCMAGIMFNISSSASE